VATIFQVSANPTIGNKPLKVKFRSSFVTHEAILMGTEYRGRLTKYNIASPNGIEFLTPQPDPAITLIVNIYNKEPDIIAIAGDFFTGYNYLLRWNATLNQWAGYWGDDLTAPNLPDTWHYSMEEYNGNWYISSTNKLYRLSDDPGVRYTLVHTFTETNINPLYSYGGYLYIAASPSAAWPNERTNLYRYNGINVVLIGEIPHTPYLTPTAISMLGDGGDNIYINFERSPDVAIYNTITGIFTIVTHASSWYSTSNLLYQNGTMYLLMGGSPIICILHTVNLTTITQITTTVIQKVEFYYAYQALVADSEGIFYIRGLVNHGGYFSAAFYSFQVGIDSEFQLLADLDDPTETDYAGTCLCYTESV
jgi:hypothetical protein